MVEDVWVGREDPVRQPVVAHELPDVFHWVQLGGFGRQEQERDVGRDHEPAGLMPAGLVEQDDSVSAGGDRLRDLGEVQAHALAGAAGQNKTGTGAFGRTDRPEDVGRRRPLVLGS